MVCRLPKGKSIHGAKPQARRRKMKRPWSWFEKGIGWCGAFLLVAASLPFIALALFLLRGVLLVAALFGIVGVGALYCAHSRFRHWADAHTRRTRPMRVF
jgi:hypothetical protein